MNEIKDHILDTVSDLVTNFVYYDRKEDEDLPLGAIETAIKDGHITADQIIERFSAELKKGLE